MFKKIKTLILELDANKISNKRKKELQLLIDYIASKANQNEVVNLNFICTHNSRRSQLSQLWATVAASYYDIDINSFSGGVEVTAFNYRAVESIKRFGFEVEKESKEDNPIYNVKWDSSSTSLNLFSKLFDDETSPKSNFAAIMTCSHADENCPFITGAEARIPIRFNDPKEYDNTELETKKYDERSLEIANDLFYVFSKVSK